MEKKFKHTEAHTYTHNFGNRKSGNIHLKELYLVTSTKNMSTLEVNLINIFFIEKTINLIKRLKKI